MPVMRMHFYEVEHEGDLENYADGFRKLDVLVSGMGIDGSEDDETGWLDVPYKDADEWAAIAAKLKGTDALDFYTGREKRN